MDMQYSRINEIGIGAVIRGRGVREGFFGREACRASGSTYEVQVRRYEGRDIVRYIWEWLVHWGL